jgi:pimeloyl-ACP methyl ester carboxylesterase
LITKINNISIAYDETGHGQPLVLVHGYPLSRQMWAPQLAGLSDAARVLAPDLRGHGESQAVPGPYWMNDLADDLNAFLDVLGINQPVVLCGLSMGGYVAMAFYRQHAVRLAGLILAATRAGPDSEEARSNRLKAAATAREKGPTAIADSMLPKMLAPGTYQHQPNLVDRVRAIMLSTSLEGILGDLEGLRERPDSYPTLDEISLPTLILHGADDQIIPVKEAEAMRDRISTARLEVIPDAGHLLNLEQPDRFNQAIRDFLGSLPLRAGGQP